jgi:hypothetical protein
MRFGSGFWRLSWAMGASWEMELLMRWYELGAGVGIWQLGAGRWNLPAPLRGYLHHRTVGDFSATRSSSSLRDVPTFLSHESSAKGSRRLGDWDGLTDRFDVYHLQ